jgi:hypothetical protein
MGGARMINTGFVSTARGNQLIGLLLATVPLAERLLIYNFAMAAWIMLPTHRSRPEEAN